MQIHVAPVFAPARIQKIFLANYLCIGFMPRGIKSELITFRITKAKAKENSGEGGSTYIQLKLVVMQKQLIGTNKLKKRESEKIILGELISL